MSAFTTVASNIVESSIGRLPIEAYAHDDADVKCNYVYYCGEEAAPCLPTKTDLILAAMAAHTKASDPTTMVTWDIETIPKRYVGSQAGPYQLQGVMQVAPPEADDHITLISATGWYTGATKRVCLVDREIAPSARWTTVVCNSQESLVRAFFLMIAAFAPDLLVGPDCIGSDWRFLSAKAAHFGLNRWVIEKLQGIAAFERGTIRPLSHAR